MLRRLGMRAWILLAVALTSAAVAASGQPLQQEPTQITNAPSAIGSSLVAIWHTTRERKVGIASSRRGVLLRSNVALTAALIDGVEIGDSAYGLLRNYRFATLNHVSLGYGWRKNFAPTIDGFRLVVPHQPNSNERDKFEMRVDAEVLGVGLGTTSFFSPLSLHVGQTIGCVMGRVGGELLDAPKYKGFAGLAFVGYEFMRSERIGIVLSAQFLNVLLFNGNTQLATRAFGASLGVTYW